MRETIEYLLLKKVASIYDQRFIAGHIGTERETVNRKLKNPECEFSKTKYDKLIELLPKASEKNKQDFTFIDLFAGIGGIRKGFENNGGKCVFTSEYDKYAVRTYMANFYSDHEIMGDIREITQPEGMNDEQRRSHVDKMIPDHDVLLAGFPCQPFSIAGVSKKKSLGDKHGFECKTQGTLFFDVARILSIKKPAVFVLENVKNLKSHNQGNTFRVIKDTLRELNYFVADLDVDKKQSDAKIIDAQNFVPQHRERIILAGFRKNLNIHRGFTLSKIDRLFPEKVASFGDILEKNVDDKYILTPKLWEYLKNYAAKHRAKGNGFGYTETHPNSVARTLSARYYKDGSEILIYRGKGKRPRRLTPRECSRLMGFDGPDESNFVIPVSDTQAYKQFGNSVVVPVFTAIAKLMRPFIKKAVRANKKALSEMKKAV